MKFKTFVIAACLTVGLSYPTFAKNKQLYPTCPIGGVAGCIFLGVVSLGSAIYGVYKLQDGTKKQVLLYEEHKVFGAKNYNHAIKKCRGLAKRLGKTLISVSNHKKTKSGAIYYICRMK